MDRKDPDLDQIRTESVASSIQTDIIHLIESTMVKQDNHEQKMD